MSTRSFVDALIGLAREHKSAARRAAAADRRATGRGRVSLVAPMLRPAFGSEVAARLIASGYFARPEAFVFGDALQGLLENYTPKKKEVKS